MYDATDPRSKLPGVTERARPAPVAFAGAEFGLFYQDLPQEDGAEGQSWYTRGQNFLVAYTEAQPGARLARKAQVDEYIVILPDPGPGAILESGDMTVRSEGFSLIIMPPGRSALTLPEGGRVIRLFSTRSEDLAAKCANASSYDEPHPNIPPFHAWPEPPDGYRIRRYCLDVPDKPGRFGRIWRCTTLMVNFLPRQVGPRDITKLSPHHHDDFEQCSLALEGAFTHHIRWPWTVDMNQWRDDVHAQVASPSVAIIPPPAIHTTGATQQGVNQLVDIFAPPRVDFSQKPGWVLNADEYPMP
jgi:hypothetical protein